MTADDMAQVYAAAFPETRPWSASEIESLIQPPGFVVTAPSGFAIGRSVAGEAELVTIAVAPPSQGKGIGRSLLRAFEEAVDAENLFLEVAADNAPAHALYNGTGWVETGRRKAYYPRATGPAVDALIMTKRRRSSSE